MMALVGVELKKLYRDPTSLAVILAMPVVLTLVFYLAMGDMPTWWLEGATHFEFLVPGTMGIAVIYMTMLFAMAICTYRDAGLLKRLETTPASASTYLGSQVVANAIIGAGQGLVVLLLSVALGFRPQGGLPGVLLTVVFLGLLSVAAVGFGLLTATVAKSSGAASGLSMIFVIPMMIFGTWLAAFNEMTFAIARFTPNFYVTESLTRIFHGAPFLDGVVWKNLVILAMVSLIAATLGIRIFKQTEYR
jgi:ABC-type multidrug transport system permease subunit